MKSPIPKEKNYIKKEHILIQGTPAHQQALVVPEIVMSYGSIAQKLITMPLIGKNMFKCVLELKKSMKAFNKQHISRNRMDEKELRELRRSFEALGISEVAFTDIRSEHYFKESALMFQHAIVFIMEMKHTEIDTAPSLKANKEIFRTYYELSSAANKVSDHLKSQGYGAQPVAAISNNLNLTVLARDAGLGEIGKHGLLINSRFGPSLRIAAILCNIENLPSRQKNDSWIKDFCDSCNACVKGCPSQAIYDSPIIHEFGQTCIDYEKCAIPFSNNYGCTLCVKNCTFYKSDFNKIKNGYKKR